MKKRNTVKIDARMSAQVADDSIITAAPGPDRDNALNIEAPKKARMADFALELTEVEGEVITALRVWTRAQERPALRSELVTWNEIQLAADMTPEERADYVDGWDPGMSKQLLKAAKACRKFIRIREKERKADARAKREAASAA